MTYGGRQPSNSGSSAQVRSTTGQAERAQSRAESKVAPKVVTKGPTKPALEAMPQAAQRAAAKATPNAAPPAPRVAVEVAPEVQPQAAPATTPTTSVGYTPRNHYPTQRGKRSGKHVRDHNDAGPSGVQKRTRPDDTTTPTGDSKRVRPGTGTKKASYAEAFKSHELCIAVMTHPAFDLSTEQGEGIKKCLEERLQSALDNPTTNQEAGELGYRGKAYVGEGVLKLWCEDDDSVKWIRRTVEDIASPIAGTRLVVRPQAEIQKRLLCGLHIPAPEMAITRVRHYLTSQNRKYDVNSWTLVRAERQPASETPGIYLLLKIPETQVALLKNNERRMKWMFGNVYVRILGDDTGGAHAPAMPTPTPAPTPAQDQEMEGTTTVENQPAGTATATAAAATDPPATEVVEDFFLDGEGSEASESCLNSSPMRDS